MHVAQFIFKESLRYKRYLFGMTCATIAFALNGTCKSYLMKSLLDGVQTADFSYMIKLVAAYACFQVVLVITCLISDWCASCFSAELESSVACTLTSRLSLYPYAFFQKNLSGNIASKISDASTLAPSVVFTFIYQFINFALTMLIALTLLSRVSKLFALALLIWIVVFLTLTYLVACKAAVLVSKRAEAKSSMMGNLADYLTNTQTVRLFASRILEMQRFENYGKTFTGYAKEQGRFLTIFFGIRGIITSVYLILCILSLIYLTKKGLITSGDFALVFMLHFNAFDQLDELAYHLRNLVANWGTIGQALSLFEKEPEVQDIPNAPHITIDKGCIVFDRVTFGYDKNRPLFKNLSITITAGQKVGLVGYSGSGKTTFAHLILRLYDIQDGSITIDGQNIQNVNQDSLRRNIGVVTQEPSLFHRSVGENIVYGKTDASRDAIKQASSAAYADEFISMLEDGYDTAVGERGTKLSGGQRQRVTVARAFLKDAPILILDEATSQLDSLTEKRMQASIDRLCEGKTALIIAHHLATIVDSVDRVLVFKDGCIVEDGKPHDLLSQNGLFKQLWDTQIGH